MSDKPLNGIFYGPPKVGKTLSLVRAFPDALFIAPRGSLLCASWLGWEPKVIEVNEQIGIAQITKMIEKASDKYPAIVIDDLSLIADAEVIRLKKANPNGFRAFDLFNQLMFKLRDASRQAECHVFWTMHEQAPKEVGQEGQRRWVKGCPMVPGWVLPATLPAMADVVARVVHDTSIPGAWPYVYQIGPCESYISGDRLSVMPARFPLNLREAMLAAGYAVPRPEPLVYLDEHVDALCHKLLPEMAQKRPDVKSVLRDSLPELQKNIEEPRHIRWAMADALDRAYLQHNNNNMLDDFVQSL